MLSAHLFYFEKNYRIIIDFTLTDTNYEIFIIKTWVEVIELIFSECDWSVLTDQHMKKKQTTCLVNPWILSKDVVLALLYKVYLVKRVISLVNTVQYT